MLVTAFVGVVSGGVEFVKEIPCRYGMLRRQTGDEKSIGCLHDVFLLGSIPANIQVKRKIDTLLEGYVEALLNDCGSCHRHERWPVETTWEWKWSKKDCLSKDKEGRNTEIRDESQGIAMGRHLSTDIRTDGWVQT